LRAKQGLAAAATAGLLPLDVLLARMRGEPLPNGEMPTDLQVQAAIAAAPFLHARLSASDMTVQSDSVVRVVSDRPMTPEQWSAQYAAPANDRVGEPLADERKVSD
jgi:hypothetical protein